MTQWLTADWTGRRLPTEAEWEHASGVDWTGPLPWGNDLVGPDGAWNCNIWQGEFPIDNHADDGWLTTAPVRSYEPNGFGLWQPVGNVWEWCSDWFDRGSTNGHLALRPRAPRQAASA
ncbi:MAG: SUMF1/EgtB/PvdO family nonheme iron enzyme [Acidimicrobiales bacterium]